MMNSEISTGTKINQGTTGKYKSVPGVTRNKHYYIYRGTNTQELVGGFMIYPTGIDRRRYSTTW